MEGNLEAIFVSRIYFICALSSKITHLSRPPPSRGHLYTCVGVCVCLPLCETCEGQPKVQGDPVMGLFYYISY